MMAKDGFFYTILTVTSHDRFLYEVHKILAII